MNEFQKQILARLTAIERKLDAVELYMITNREFSQQLDLDTEDYDVLLQQFAAIRIDLGASS